MQCKKRKIIFLSGVRKCKRREGEKAIKHFYACLTMRFIMADNSRSIYGKKIDLNQHECLTMK